MCRVPSQLAPGLRPPARPRLVAAGRQAGPAAAEELGAELLAAGGEVQALGVGEVPLLGDLGSAALVWIGLDWLDGGTEGFNRWLFWDLIGGLVWWFGGLMVEGFPIYAAALV